MMVQHRRRVLAAGSGRRRRAMLLAATAAVGIVVASQWAHPWSVAHAVAAVRFFAGVFALAALSLTVAVGLLASERVLLGAPQRVWAQSTHRALGLLGVICLVTHVITEVTAHRVAPLAVAVPFVFASVYLGLGTIAGYLALAVAWTGLIRARFAGSARPWRWRAVHATGYLCWPIAILHGLHAGRAPAAWVTAGYLLMLTLVAIAAGVRLSAELRRRRARTARLVPGLRARLVPGPQAGPVSGPQAGLVPGPQAGPVPGPRLGILSRPTPASPSAAGGPHAPDGRRPARGPASFPGHPESWPTTRTEGPYQPGRRSAEAVVDLDGRPSAHRSGPDTVSPRNHHVGSPGDTGTGYLAALHGKSR